MGPILEEFKLGKKLLADTMFELYNDAIKLKGHKGFHRPHTLKITAQGGIGTFEEDEFLHSYYELESTGWGTPFLLVPEATTVDETTLDLLCKATKDDVVLSNNSPLGVRFHYLKGSSSDIEKQDRIRKGEPGSPCTEKHLVFNTEFTEKPICTASRKYQTLKIAQLQSFKLPAHEYEQQLTKVLDKECLCIGLSNAVAAIYKLPFIKKQEAVTICPGPNIANFSNKVSLETMVGHIYGRTDIINNDNRPHMFISELNLYINYLEEQLTEETLKEPDNRRKKYYNDFFKNMKDGINYYRRLPILIKNKGKKFQQDLDLAEEKLNKLFPIKLAYSKDEHS